MDCSLPGSSLHGIFQEIVLEWVAISFSTQELNLGLPHCRQTLYCLSHQRSSATKTLRGIYFSSKSLIYILYKIKGFPRFRVRKHSTQASLGPFCAHQRHNQSIAAEHSLSFNSVQLKHLLNAALQAATAIERVSPQDETQLNSEA